MAICVQCDKCGVSTKNAGRELWAVVTLAVVKSKPESYDLCAQCYRDVFSLLTGRGAQLTLEQQELLAQIWSNAQNFDQSIGDIH